MEILLGLGLAAAGAWVAREIVRAQQEAAQPVPQPVPVRSDERRRG